MLGTQEKEEILNGATRKYCSMKNRRERPGTENDLRKNATPIAADPSVDNIELLSSSSLSSSRESSVSSKSNVLSESGDSSSNKL